MDLKATLAENVRALRNRKDWTQEELADRAGLDRVTINRVEGGKRAHPLDVVQKIADALGVKLDRLLRPSRSAA